jgi:hypothetical protein
MGGRQFKGLEIAHPDPMLDFGLLDHNRYCPYGRSQCGLPVSTPKTCTAAIEALNAQLGLETLAYGDICCQYTTVSTLS